MRHLSILAGAALLAVAPASVSAQDGPARRLMRGDLSGTVGWVATNKGEFSTYNDWHGQGEASLGVGWYWTDHHQTRIEVARTTETSVYSSTPLLLSGQLTTYVPSHLTFQSLRVAVIQHYQFRRNEFVHPFVGAGIDIVRETSSREDAPAFSYDPITRQSRQVRPGMQYRDVDDTTARALLTAGTKAYFTRNVFGLTDLRVSAGRRRVEDVQLRLGLGVDF